MNEVAESFVFYPWPEGSRFVIRNNTMSGKEVIEGIATVREHLSDDRYMVEFDDESGAKYERRVLGGDLVVAN